MTPTELDEYQRGLAAREARRRDIEARLGWNRPADRSRCRVDEDEVTFSYPTFRTTFSKGKAEDT